MNDSENVKTPRALEALLAETRAAGFSMPSDLLTGALLRMLAASKPGGKMLELGTGTGLATAWILDGMDADASLISVDNSEQWTEIARRHLGRDGRVTFVVSDGAAFLATLEKDAFDFIFADTWPGKFDHLDEALALLKRGGFYLIDDLLPQTNWPVGHAPRVPKLIEELERRRDLKVMKMGWSTGILLGVKV